MKTFRFLLAGLGNIGRTFLEIVAEREALLASRYGLRLQAVAVADSSGVLANPDGVDLHTVIAAKRQRASVASLKGARPGESPVLALELLGADVDIVFDATPVNLTTGEPGFSLTRNALARGLPVVTANKGPLALKFAELAQLSDWGDRSRPKLRFSGAVGGAMPTINVGVYDMPCARISRVDAVLNATTQVILEMMSDGSSYEEAVSEAQRLGIAETDPTLDVEGWDAANKLVIITNAVLGQPATLDDVAVTGISGATAHEARAAKVVGERLSLLATAEWDGEKYKLTVAPTALQAAHPFGRLSGAEMAVMYESDIYERITLITRETGPMGSSAAMLRDFINIALGQ